MAVSSTADNAAAIDRFLGFWDGALTPMEAIEARHAVRSYTAEPIAGEVVDGYSRRHQFRDAALQD